MSFLTDDQFGRFDQSGNGKMKPFPIEADEFTPDNWKSGDSMYPGERDGFSKSDRTLWRKDRYNAVHGRFRDKNGEYRDKSGRFIGEDNTPLLTFKETKPFPGWANDPGSQFHPDDHPQMDERFYRNPENQPAVA